MNNTDYAAIVVCSTKNQMVNYLTILQHYHQDMDIINITFDNTCSDFDNPRWDQNLSELLHANGLKIEDPITFTENDIQDHESIVKKIGSVNDRYKNKKILWNITGGQRHLVMAITNLIHMSELRQQDTMVYFEGNHSKFYYYNRTLSEAPEDLSPSISEEKLSLQVALRLMGFEMNDNLRKENLLKKQIMYYYLTSKNDEEFSKKVGDATNTWDNYRAEHQCYTILFNALKNDAKCVLLDILKETNKANPDSQGTSKLDQFVNKLKQLSSEIWITKETFKEEMCEQEMNEKIFNVLHNSLQSRADSKLFGYIFEYMVFYKIIDVIKREGYENKISDIHLSAKVRTPEKDSTTKLGIIDELDIAMITRSGKVIIFECKSGNFTGDNIKSHHYSTYAVSGVYGTPILIAPLTKQMSESGHDELAKEVKSKEGLATKARVRFWFLDQLDEELLQLLKREVVKDV